METKKAEEKFVRKQYLVKNFQLKFVYRFITLLVIASVVLGVILYYLCSNSVTTAFENSRLVVKTTADFILPAIIIGSLIMFIFVGIISIILTIMFTHKIAGPLYRIEKFIVGFKDGYISNFICLRSTDEIKDLAEKCNDMSKEFSCRIEDIKKDIRRIEDVQEKVSSLTDAKKIAAVDIENVINEIADIKYNLSYKISYFKTK